MYLLSANETVCNTSQKKDENVSGTQLIVDGGTVPQTMVSTADHIFILLLFTSANGEAFCCVVLLQSMVTSLPELANSNKTI